jgi:hypothetical protein
MENPSERGLTLTLSWTAGSKKRSAVVPVGPAARVVAMLALCALSYEFGALRARLEVPVPPPVLAPMKLASLQPTDKTAEEPSQVITPLNVRDPSALVMGPSSSWNPPAAPVPSVAHSAPREVDLRAVPARP